MSMNYAQARADHEHLWAINPADDMTGAYVDQDDLKALLRNPTKAEARRRYEQQIAYWFHAGPDPFGLPPGWPTDPMVAEIAERHACEDDLDRLRARFKQGD